MAKVFQSETGASVVIASDDHCPPHIHAMHRPEGWVARISFSFLDSNVTVMDIAPQDTAVRHRQLNLMLSELRAHLPACRHLWWQGKATTCLEQKWIIPMPTGKPTLAGKRRSGALQVASAHYDWHADATMIIFTDGSQYRSEREANE